MGCFRLSVQVYGPLIIRWDDGCALRLPGAKQRAMIALLATAPGAARTRPWLQSQLWSDSDDQQGRANLRQALFQLHRALGDRFDAVIRTEGDVIAMVEGAFELTGDPDSGEFLEGIDIAEEGFEDWLREMRSAPPLPTQTRDAALAPVRLRPKLAVLPFLEYPVTDAPFALGDAVALELIRVLSRSQMVDIVAHLSSRSFDPRHLEITTVSARLEVDYLITGRCALSGETLALDIDFQDIADGSLIWSERFTLSLRDFLAANAEPLHEIARRVVQSIFSVSVELGVTRPLPNLDSHAHLMAAIALMHHMGSSNFDRALTHLEEVVRRAPRHAIPRAWRAQWHILRIFQGWSEDPKRDRQRAADEVDAALDLNPECAFSLAMDGNVKTTLVGEFDAAERSFDASLALNPSSPLACQLKSLLRCYAGRGSEAVALAERARQLSPCDPRGPFFDALSAAAHLADSQYEKAIDLAERSLRSNPRHVSAHRARVIGLARLGRMQEAGDAVRELLTHAPTTTVAGYLATHPAARTRVGRDWAEALGEAGVPRG